MKNFQDLTVTDYLRIVRRRIWYLIIPTVLISIGTVIYVWRLPSWYKSETTIAVSDRLLPEDYIGSLVRQGVADRVEFARTQLKSRTFVERIAQEFQLVPPGANADAVLNAVINSTEVTVLPPSAFRVGFYSTDPNTAQAITRRLAERIVQTNEQSRQEKVAVADEFLDQQLRQVSDELTQADRKLREFYVKNFPGVPEQGATLETMASLQAQLTAADNELQDELEQKKGYERTLLEQRDLKAIAKASSDPPVPSTDPAAAAAEPTAPPTRQPSPLEIGLAQKKAELAGALSRYTTQHPDVARLQREVRDLEKQIAERPPDPAVKETPVVSAPVSAPVQRAPKRV